VSVGPVEQGVPRTVEAWAAAILPAKRSMDTYKTYICDLDQESKKKNKKSVETYKIKTSASTPRPCPARTPSATSSRSSPGQPRQHADWARQHPYPGSKDVISDARARSREGGVASATPPGDRLMAHPCQARGRCTRDGTGRRCPVKTGVQAAMMACPLCPTCATHHAEGLHGVPRPWKRANR